MKHRFVRTLSFGADGQILVLAALLMVILIGITGLAIDVSAAYVADRWQRSVADAAALAGGQDLQIPGSKDPPTATERGNARVHAMQVLVAELRSTDDPTALAITPACLTAVGCALQGTPSPYVVSVQTPSPSFVDCDPNRCIQVSVKQPSFGLTFGRIFGQDSWIVSATSVAGVVQARQYGMVTLRPPDPRVQQNGADFNEKDIRITGGSRVTVNNADVGTNTNLEISGVGNNGTPSALILQNPPDPGPYTYLVWHWDAYQAWADPPPGSQLTSPITDPDYSIPQADDVSAGCPTTSSTICSYTQNDLSDAMLGGAPGSAACQTQMALVPAEYRVAGTSIRDMTPSKVTCLMPGVYTKIVRNNSSDEAMLLTPGVYFFDAGLDIATTLIGGYEADQAGVAVIFPTCPGNNCPGFAGNSSPLVALNFGGEYQNAGQCTDTQRTGCRATAAEWNGGYVQTDTDPPMMLTIMVEPDDTCLQSPFPFSEPSNACSIRQPQLKLPGGGSLSVAGVQYAPTDNTQVTGSSPQTGVLGQIISWTISFTGDSTLNLEAAISEENGVLRLDPACSPSVSTCTP